MHESVGSCAELPLTIFLSATEGSSLALCGDLDVSRTALDAAYSVRPSLLDKPLLGSGIVGEHLKEPFNAQSLSVVFSWSVPSHLFSLTYKTIILNSPAICQGVI